MKDYTGKTLFVGIDVHKKTYAVTVICDGDVVKRDTLKANPSTLIAYLTKRFDSGKIKSAYEAGFCGFHLHRKLIEAGIENIVVNPAGIEVSNSKVKTDKKDSLKIAAQLSEKKLKCVHIPSIEKEDDRTVTRLRDKFSKEKTRIGNRIKSSLLLHGLLGPDDKKKVSRTWIENLLILNMSPGLKIAIGYLASVWLFFDEKIKELEEEMKKQAIKEKDLEAIWQSAPGIGPISGRVLANELGDMKQFANERQLFSYAGLTPTEHSSGEHTRQGHITKQGKPILRKLLVQAAWTAVRCNKEIESVFNRIASKAGVKRAIIGIARRLIGHLRACFRTGKMYERKRFESMA
jgi:transposase